ncbi:hypothetical protein VNO80_30677 [Phaseolus coccineus]|uniref:Uncharacterized protein n=1 Tax=Phaseolus coccineus TaxID=3886 RepID=A0AAN9LE99_PHACN
MSRALAMTDDNRHAWLKVLPDEMIFLAKPDPGDMVLAIQKAIPVLPKIDLQMRELYNWHDVAKRTEFVYDRALKCSIQNLLESLSRYLFRGAWACKLFCLVMIIGFLLWQLLELWQIDDIEEVSDFIHPHNCDEDMYYADRVGPIAICYCNCVVAHQELGRIVDAIANCSGYCP